MDEKKSELIRKKNLYLRILEALNYSTEVQLKIVIAERGIIPHRNVTDEELHEDLVSLYQRKLNEVCKQLDKINEAKYG